MAILTTKNLCWGPLSMPGHTTGKTSDSSVTFSLNDSDNALGLIWLAPKDGIIDSVGVQVTNVYGTPPTYSVGIYEADGTTLLGGSAAEEFNLATVGVTWCTLATPATVSAGELFRVKIQPGATPPDGSNYVRIAVSRSNVSWNNPISPQYTTGATNTGASLSIRYDDGTAYLPLPDGNSSGDVYPTSTPDEYGNRFSVPFDCECSGAMFALYVGRVNAVLTFTLYDASDTELVATTVTSNSYIDTGGIWWVPWDTVSLIANAVYRITCKPTVYNVYFTINKMKSAADRAWWPEGERWQLTTRTDSGGWTDSTTDLLACCLVLDQITLPDGGGPGGSGAWSGGMLVG